MATEGNWHVVKSEVRVRPGVKAGWVEVMVVAPDGQKVTKYVMRKVERFYSERDESAIE